MKKITLKEIIYNLKNLKAGGRQSQDVQLSDAQYAFIIDYYRGILISRDYMKRNQLAPQVEQTLEVKFKRAKDVEDEFNSKLVYKVELPSVVQTPRRPLYEGVRTSMLASSISRSTSKTIRNDLKSPITGNDARYFPMGDSLYVVTDEPLEKLYVSAVFDSPLKIEEYLERVNPFDPFDFEYSMSPNMIDTIYKMVVDGEIRWSIAMPQDHSNDGREEQGGKVPKKQVKEQVKEQQDE